MSAAPCILCDSQAIVAVNDTLKLKTWDCPWCRRFTLVADVAAELTKLPNWKEFRPKMAKAVRWGFFKGEPAALASVMSAEKLVWYHEQFEEEPEAQERAVAELITAAPVADPLAIGPMTKFGRVLGKSPEEACEHAKKLEADGIVRIVKCETGRLIPGAESFGQLKRWERCEAAKKGE
jgi:hypothetical protein